MKTITEEWVRKAEADFNTATRAFQADPPNYDAVTFHAQQCAENYLKAHLTEFDVPFPKTHYLGTLLDLTYHSNPLGKRSEND